ncbi:hypothetical protein JCM24511_01943 [Saitozyma sp. JCM 24511]|nr:hypothetical protein JCM24511_01943 [Saitozyma sp. JCM 24511]
MFKSLPSFKVKSLPQAIGLPFLSTQEDAQLKFRSGEGGIKRLYGDEVIPLNDVGYWAQYYSLFSSAADVYSLISVQDLRQALIANPVNLSHLLTYLSHHLFTLLPSAQFPSSPGGPDSSREALNCLRVLGRVLVVVYEAEADAKANGIGGEETFAAKYLWARVPVEGESSGTGEGNGAGTGVAGGLEETGEQFKIEDSDSEEEEEEEENEEENEIEAGVKAFKASVGRPMVPKSKSEAQAKTNGTTDSVEDPLRAAAAANESAEDKQEEDAREMLPSLVDRLFSCTIDLLFCAGFTVPESVRGRDNEGEKINYVIWEKGVGSTVSIGSTAELDRNKVEVLRFLMILLSTTMYTPPHALHTTPNLPLSHLTHALERRLLLSLLCSFLNTSLATSRPAGVSLGQLPYNHLISKSAEERRTLVRACMMVLLVALDYREPEIAGMGEAKEENAFRYFVSKLHRKEDFAFVLGGILGILEEHVAVTNIYLPGSKRPVPYILETFMLLWRVVDLNKRFRQYIYDSGKANDVIGYILLCCLDLKDDPSHHGLLRMLSYLLQTLSADQAFAQALTSPIRLSIPAKWAVPGSAADFMIVSIYSIATTPGLNPLFPALTISIANITPHLQNIGVQASTRLMQLFKAFSAPNFLLADEGHPRLVYYLLETFNSILYHQLSENPNLVYAILRAHQDFQTLATFSLVSGLRDIQRRKALRAAAEQAKIADEPKTLTRTNSELDMLAEKAALLGRELNDEEEEPSGLPVGAQPVSPAPARVSIDQTTAQPLTTPGETAADPLARVAEVGGTTNGPDATSQTSMSEKARGKMRATDPVDLSSPATADLPEVPDEELLAVAAAGVGPNGYVPTQEWVSSWQKGLPLDPVLVAISELLPKIQESQPRAGAPSQKVFNILKGASLVDVLPPAPPIMPRRFQWSPASAVWLTSLLWGDIYVAGLTSIGIWRDTTVRLFGIKQAPAKRTAQESVGRVLKMFGVV